MAYVREHKSHRVCWQYVGYKANGGLNGDCFICGWAADYHESFAPKVTIENIGEILGQVKQHIKDAEQ